jgi:hypothetical protein
MRIMQRLRTAELVPAHLPAIALSTNPTLLPPAHPLLKLLSAKSTHTTTIAAPAIIPRTIITHVHPPKLPMLTRLSINLTRTRMTSPPGIFLLLLTPSANMTITTPICGDNMRKASCTAEV